MCNAFTFDVVMEILLFVDGFSGEPDGIASGLFRGEIGKVPEKSRAGWSDCRSSGKS